MATIIWMCLQETDVFNKFVPWKPFMPFSRLTYSVYLTRAWIVIDLLGL
jgi:hypothetical protein